MGQISCRSQAPFQATPPRSYLGPVFESMPFADPHRAGEAQHRYPTYAGAASVGAHLVDTWATTDHVWPTDAKLFASLSAAACGVISKHLMEECPAMSHCDPPPRSALRRAPAWAVGHLELAPHLFRVALRERLPTCAALASHRICLVSKDDTTRKETAIYAADSIMRRPHAAPRAVGARVPSR